MKGILVFAFLLVSVSAFHRLDKLHRRQRKWDIAEGITGAELMGKVEGHEKSVKDAYNKLSAADKQVFSENPSKSAILPPMLHNPTALIMGVQYPDMPLGGPNPRLLGDDLPKPDHVNALTFGTYFKAGEGGDRTTFVSQTHYGCLQFWHAMAPEPYVDGKYKVWSNSALSELLKASTRRIWDVAVAKLKAGKKQLAEFHLGRVLHTIGDSYAKGHTIRGPSPCGKIFVFQEYNAQAGNAAHASSDKPSTNSDTFICTTQRVKETLEAWAGCVRNPSLCAYPAIVASTFDVDPSVATKDAGGAIEKHVGPLTKAKGAKTTVTIAGKTENLYYPPQNGRTRIAGTADVSQACPPF